MIGPRCAHVHDGQVRARTAHRPDIRPQPITVAALIVLFSCCVDGRSPYSRVRPRQLGRQSQPGSHCRFNDCQLRVTQFAELTNQFRVRNRDEVLGIEYARPQKPDRDFGFKMRLTRTGRVWDQGDQRAISVRSRHTDDEGRSDLGCHSEIDEPHFATARTRHGAIRDDRVR